MIHRGGKADGNVLVLLGEGHHESRGDHLFENGHRILKFDTDPCFGNGAFD
jgi:hypothetical protein